MATLARISDKRVNPHSAITKDEVAVQGPKLAPKYTDAGAIKLVTQDAQRAETFIDQRQWNLHWREADVLYQSPRGYEANDGKARVSRFTVANITNSLVPAMKSGIFYETPPFLIRNRPGQQWATARAKQALYGAQLDAIDFEAEVDMALEQMTLYGTVICKGGWITETRMRKKFIRNNPPLYINMPLTGQHTISTKESNEFEVQDVEVTRNEPFFAVCELGSVSVDPGWRHPNRLHSKAKYVVETTYPTFADLDTLRQQVQYDANGKQVGGYDIPSEEELKAFFFASQQNAAAASDTEMKQGNNMALHHADNRNEITTDDPLDQPIKMLERWDKERVMSVLVDNDGNAVLIRNEHHNMGIIPYFSGNFWNIPNAGFGIGVGRLAGDDQRIEKGTIEAVLNLLAYIVQPQYARDRGANAPTQQIRQRLGGIIDVDVPAGKSVRDAFGIIEQPRVDPSLFAVLQEASSNARSTTGSDQAFNQGVAPSRPGSSVTRTATGAGGIQGALAQKIDGPVGHFVKGVFLPFLHLLEAMDKERLPLAEIQEIIGKELGEAFTFDEDDFLNSEEKFEVLAGAHLAAKKAMAQILPVLIQILENPQVIPQLNQMGYMVDVKELLEMVYEMTEWKNAREVIRPMNQQEFERFQQASQTNAKLQAAIAQIQAKHAAKTEEIDQSAEARLASKMTEYPMEQAARYEERRQDREMFRTSAFGL